MVVAIEKLITADIQKPARYLGTELGSIHKPWHDATVRWVLTYPEIYEVGASNLGHIILYNILNDQAGQLCDRSYLPAADLAKKLRETDTPLFAVESRRSLLDFDILGFSLAYELGATNVLEMLTLAQIPLTWQARQQDSEKWPLVFAGGQTATSNPEPYADFFDFMAMGDGEELLPEIGEVLRQGKEAGLDRQALLLALAQVPGVYVPQFYGRAEDGSVYPLRDDVPSRILRRVSAPMPEYAIGLVPYNQTVHDRLVIEIRRGCTRGCRFCQPGMLTRPARDVEPERVINTIEKGMKATGHNEFSLLSLSCSDYLALPAVGMEIKNRLKDHNISLSLPSQRVDRFDENIANIIGGTRQGGITFAPEAGTQRMRDIINKGLTNEELLRGVKTAYEQGWEKIKLYFMIGLPGETDADVIGIAETVKWLQKECKLPGRKRLEFNLTISNFTPKPHTPFQWHSVSQSEFVRKQALLRNELRQQRGVKANYTDVRLSVMEDVLGRGDRRLGAVIQRAWQLGAGMDAWWESLDRAFSAWTEAIEESGLSWQKLTEERSAQLPLDQPLPWDHINTGIDKEWLKTEWERSQSAITIEDCSFDSCSRCGVCGPEFGHNIIVPPPAIPAFLGESAPNQQRVQRLRVWFGKLGDMALISHLDLVRLLDRAMRRAGLPISFSGGFHPTPRIAIASALSLGATSSGEILDVELTEKLELSEFQARLAEKLPVGLPLYQVTEIEINSPAVNHLLDQAEYLITVAVQEQVSDKPSVQEPENTENTGIISESLVEPLWQDWMNNILNQTSIIWQQRTKSGKTKTLNLRELLSNLEFVRYATNNDVSLDQISAGNIEDVIPETSKQIAVLRYVGSYKQEGGLLKPEHIIYMLEQVANQGNLAHPLEFQLLHIHRTKLYLQ